MQPVELLLLLLPLTSGDVFFASRNGNHGRGGFCISNDSSQIVAPIYDLESILSGHLSNKTIGWTSDWHISRFKTNFEVLSSWSLQHWIDLPQIVVKDKSGVIELPFDLHSAPTAGTLFFSILATSATILVTRSERVAGHGYVLQLDHFNESTGLNDFRVLKCLHVKLNDTKCQEVYTKNVDSILQRGEKWTHLKLEIVSTAEVNKFTISNKNADKLIEWTDNTNDANYHALRFVAVANPGIFKLHALPYLSSPIKSGQTPYYSLSKSIKFSRPSVLCISIISKDTSNPMSISMTVSTGGTTGTNKQIQIDCTKSGVQTQCKTGTLISGINRVVIDITNPNNITSIQNCADAYNFSVAEAENGTWFKGCQTLLNMDSTTEQTLNSSFNCRNISTPGGNVCGALQTLSAASCANLEFCTLQSKSIKPSTTPGSTSAPTPATDENIVDAKNNCSCWTDHVPFLEHVLWGVVCANMGLLVFVTLRWRMLLKQHYREHQHIEEKVFERPRLPVPGAATSSAPHLHT